MSDVIKRAQENYKKDLAHWQDIYDRARDDLRFLSDDDFAQWDERDYNARVQTRRPALTIDQLSQFVHQVANDIRMNTPTINIIPSGSDSDVETANIFKGLIRNIEYVSVADDAYDTAALNSVKSSIGFIRIDHDYINEDSFDQQLLIKRVVNPLACMIDSESTECDGRDAKHGMFLDRIPLAQFKKLYPGKDPSSFTSEEKYDNGKDEDSISVCEYFEIREQSKEIGVDDLGNVEDVVGGKKYVRTRSVKKKIVKRYKLSGKDILEETTFPGKYIPIIPVYGEEAWIEGKRNLFSLIRKSKGAQMMYNLWKSLETELLQKQPNAPIMAAEGQVEDYAEDWRDPAKAIVLRYKPVDASGNAVGAPQRLAPPTIPTGVVNAARGSIDDIKATMGLYNASIGARSNETSGVAIQARNQEGDVATFHFGDNLVRSITQVGRVLVCAIPDIYDTQRIVRIIGEEDEPKEVGINGQIVEDQEESYDLTKGIYDVRVVTGAPFTTRRQEAATFFTDIVAKQPQLMEVMGDLLFKNMDFAGAPAMAERMKKVIDPKFLSEEKDADPEKMQMQQGLQQAQIVVEQLQAQLQQVMQAAKQEMDEMEVKLASKEQEIAIKGGAEVNKAQLEQDKLQLELLKIKQEEEKMRLENEFKMADLALKSKELEIKQQDYALKNSLKLHEIATKNEPSVMIVPEFNETA